MSNLELDPKPSPEILVFGGKEHASLVLESINGADHSILVSNYIIKSDRFGTAVMKALKKKAMTGVKVKMIVDGYGSWNWIKENKEQFEASNFEIRTYHPIPWPLSKLKLRHLPHLDRFFQLIFNSNRRNHQKLFIFDGLKAIVGSRNIHDEALLWRETSLLLTGNSVKYLETIFENIWRRSRQKLLSRISPVFQGNRRFSSQEIYSNHLFSLRKQHDKIILKRISNSRKLIYITTPYLFLSKKTLKQIQERAEAGVDVRVLLPQISDVWISKAIAQAHYQGLLCAGIKIYEYTPSILHAKTIIIDDWALVGSSNFNRRSAIRDLEIDYAPTQTSTVHTLKQKFLEDIQASDHVKSVRVIGALQYFFVGLVSRLFPSWF